MRKYPSQCADQFVVRLPDGMREAIKRIAQANERSMNSEIVFHLRSMIAAYGENEKDRQGSHPDGLEQSQL